MSVETSIIVPVHSKPHRLKLMLAGLSACDLSSSELIVVADGPTPEVISILDALATNTQVLKTPGLGRAGARNVGAKAAKGSLLVFLDDDILVRPGFHKSLLAAQAAQPGLCHMRLRELVGLLRVEDPSLGGPGCPPIKIDDLENGRWSIEGARLFTSGLENAAEQVHSGAIDIDAPWLAGAGAGMSIPQTVWLALGGFDEAYGKGWGLEDLDFAIRVHQSGIPISLTEEVLGYHMSHYNPNRWDEQDTNFKLLLSKNASPEIKALGTLLASDGSIGAYTEAVRQIRTDELG